jgi:hypothetical protein
MEIGGYEKGVWRLGIPGPRELNIYLLGSWIRKYFVNKDKIWRQLVDFKYRTNKPNVLLCRDVGPLISREGQVGS